MSDPASTSPDRSIPGRAAITPVQKHRHLSLPLNFQLPAEMPVRRTTRAGTEDAARADLRPGTPISQSGLFPDLGPIPGRKLGTGDEPIREVPSQQALPRVGAHTEAPDAMRPDDSAEAGQQEVLILPWIEVDLRGQVQVSEPPAKGEPPRAVPGARWARPLGQAVIKINKLVLSPYRARLPPDPGSLRVLADSLASGVQPIPPVFVRRKNDQWELLGGHCITLAGQQYLGWEEVLAVVLDIPDDMEAAYWVIGSNEAHAKLSKWELMRAVRILLAFAPGDEVRTQREIARRNKWCESAVSEAKYWARAITPAVIEMAGVDEARHSAPLNDLTREHLREVRWGATEMERAAILRRLVLGPGESLATTGDLPEVDALFSTAMVGPTWKGEVMNLKERSEAEMRVICRRMVQRLKAEHRALRDPG